MATLLKFSIWENFMGLNTPWLVDKLGLKSQRRIWNELSHDFLNLVHIMF